MPRTPTFLRHQPAQRGLFQSADEFRRAQRTTGVCALTNRRDLGFDYRTQGRTPYQAFVDRIAAMREGSEILAANSIAETEVKPEAA